MQTSDVQTFIAKNLAKNLTKKTHRKVNIEKVKYSILNNKLRLTNIFIADERQDTLLFVKKIEAHIQGINLVSNNFRLRRIDMEEPYVKIISYDDSTMNILTFIDALSGQKEDSTQNNFSYFFEIPEITIKKGQFAYQSYDREPIRYGMNYGNLHFKDIDAEVTNLRNVGDTIKMNIPYLKTTERCGLSVREMDTEFIYTESLLQFDNVHIKTRRSRLNAKHLKFSSKTKTKAWGDFINKMHLDYLIKKSRINLGELAYFNENFLGYHATATASTHATGTIAKFHCKNTIAQIYKDTKFRGDIHMYGLPETFDTFFQGKIKSFQTTLEDLAKTKIPGYSKEYLRFPTHLDSLGIIKYKGNFTGFLSDFVLYGKFNTEHGKILTDISIKNNIAKKQVAVNGKVITKTLNLGRLLNNDIIGTTSMNIDIINGTQSNKTEEKQATVKGVIENINLYNYPYKNIQIDAQLSKDEFNGNLSMKSKDIDFDFSGRIDKKTEIPKANFQLQVNHADLAKLNLNQITQDSISRLSFKMEAESNGGELDNINGTLKFDELKYTNSLGELSPTSITISSSKEDSTRTLKIKSDILDLYFKGNYRLSKLAKLPNSFLGNYINYFKPDSTNIQKRENGDIRISLKNINSVFKILAPDYQVSSDATIYCQYKLDTVNDISLNLHANSIKLFDRKLYDVVLNIDGKDSLKNTLEIERVRFAKNLSLYNFSIKSNIAKNNVHTQLEWDNKQSTRYTGKLNMNSEIIEYANGNQSIINEIPPSTFYIAGEDWHINNTRVIIDSNNWVIDKLRIFNNDTEFAELSGILSPHDKDMLYLELSQFDISHFLGIFGLDAIKLSGKVSGVSEYKKENNKYTIATDIDVPNLLLENKNIGDLQLHSEFNNSHKKLLTKATLTKEDTTKISLEGDYGINTDKLNYKLKINRQNLSPTTPILKDFLSKINGYTTGELTIKGTAKKPIANGQFHINIPQVTVAQTGVSYYIDDTIKISNSNVLLKDFDIVDKNGKKAILNGKFISNFGKTPQLNITMNTQNLQVLEEAYKPLAYGDTKVTSSFTANGSMEDINVTGQLSTDSDSKIIIPLDTADEIDESNFISFINPSDSLNFIKSKDIDTSLQDEKHPLSYNIGLNISPSTEIQVLFESKSGSAIKSKGIADLRIIKNKYNKQRIMGEYKVSQGTFFYSFNGIINKKFDLEEGGTIKWDGTPEDAFLNLNAIYRIKTAITPLLFDQKNSNNSRIIQTPVLCKIHITGQIEDPKLTFKIEFPSLDSTTKGSIESVLQTTDITKQVLSLLVFNKFIQPEFIPEVNQTNKSTDALSVTTSELLSSQISNILSQLSDDINIGFIYKPGDDLTKEEVGLALSTQLLQNRVSISGNLGFASDIENNRLNDFIGDFDFDVKIDRKGKLKLRAFSHARDNLYYYENNRNIQGVGIIYREEFNTFKELLKRYRNFFKF